MGVSIWEGNKAERVAAALEAIAQGSGGGGGGGTVSAALKSALLYLAEKVAYIDNSGPSCYQTLYDALYNGDDSGEDEPVVVTLSSISAAVDLEGHSVMVGDSLDTLRPYLTVTAIYSDASHRTVSTYVLSGTLVEGSNTITVSYEGKITTFSVTAAVPSILPAGYTEIPSLYCNGADNAYLVPGVNSGDFDYAEYSIVPTNMRYIKAGSILSSTGCNFPYLTGDNTNGERSRIGFKNFGNQESAVSSGSYLYSWNLNERHTIMGYVDGKVFIDGVELFTVPAGSAASAPLQIFKNPEGNGHYFIGRLYWLKLYKNGEIYRNYIPCKNSSNVPGLYETVEGTFIYDLSNTGEIREGGE